jgi:NitT/TauT family transport system substrate-binding protein
LEKHGVPAAEVTIVRAGVDTLPEIMEQGGIDSGMALEPFGSSLIAEGKAFALVDFRSASEVQKHLGSTYPVTALLVRQELIDKHPDAVQDLTTAIVWASRWLKTASADDVLQLLPGDYVPEPDVWRRSFEGYREVFTEDGRSDPDGIRAVVAAQAAFDPSFDPGSVDIAALYSDRFIERAATLASPGSGTEATPTQPSAGRDTAGWILLVVVILLLLAVAAFLITRSRRSER